MEKKSFQNKGRSKKKENGKCYRNTFKINILNRRIKYLTLSITKGTDKALFNFLTPNMNAKVDTGKKSVGKTL